MCARATRPAASDACAMLLLPCPPLLTLCTHSEQINQSPIIAIIFSALLQLVILSGAYLMTVFYYPITNTLASRFDIWSKFLLLIVISSSFTFSLLLSSFIFEIPCLGVPLKNLTFVCLEPFCPTGFLFDPPNFVALVFCLRASVRYKSRAFASSHLVDRQWIECSAEWVSLLKLSFNTNNNNN